MGRARRLITLGLLTLALAGCASSGGGFYGGAYGGVSGGAARP